MIYFAVILLVFRLTLTLSNENISVNLTRRLQFEGMFDNLLDATKTSRRKKALFNASKRMSKAKAMSKTVQSILVGMDLYQRWWMGHSTNNAFVFSDWSHPLEKDMPSIITSCLHKDAYTAEQYIAFLGTARKVFQGNIIIATRAGLSKETNSILANYNATVYELSDEICNTDSSVQCGSSDEKIPETAFSYYLYEKMASIVPANSLVMIANFEHTIFQTNPFHYVERRKILEDHQLILFQEFHPNSMIYRDETLYSIMKECYGEESVMKYGYKAIVSSMVLLGTRDGILVWSHYVTSELQDAPGRFSDGRCMSSTIIDAFSNWLFYSNKLRPLLNIDIGLQGEAAVNLIQRFYPPLLHMNASSSLSRKDNPQNRNTNHPFTDVSLVWPWNILDEQGWILNWDGTRSPAVVGAANYLAMSGRNREYLNVNNAIFAENEKYSKSLAALRCLAKC